MAYALVTGFKPFACEDIAELLEAQQYQEIPDSRKLLPGWPVEFYKILLTATQKDPERRFRNIWELQSVSLWLAEMGDGKDQAGLSRHEEMRGLFSYPHELRLQIDELADELARRTAKTGVSLRCLDPQDKR